MPSKYNTVKINEAKKPTYFNPTQCGCGASLNLYGCRNKDCDNFWKKNLSDEELEKMENKTMGKVEKVEVEISQTAQNIIDAELTMLNEREKQIAGMMLDGKTRKEMIEILGMKLATFTNDLTKIFVKTDELVNYKLTQNKISEFCNYFLGGNDEKPLSIVAKINSLNHTKISEDVSYPNDSIPIFEISNYAIDHCEQCEAISPPTESVKQVVEKIKTKITHNPMPEMIQIDVHNIQPEAAKKKNIPTIPECHCEQSETIQGITFQSELTDLISKITNIKTKYENELNELYTITGRKYILGESFEKDYRIDGKFLQAKLDVVEEIFQGISND